MFSKKIINRFFWKNILVSYGMQICMTSLGFLWVSFITHTAGITTLGYIALLNAMGSTLANVVSFRTNESVIYFYNQGTCKNNNAICLFSLLGGVILDLLMGLILLSLIWHFSPVLADLFLKDKTKEKEISQFAFYIIFTFLRGTGLGLLTARKSFHLTYILPVAESIIKISILAIYYVIYSKIELTNIINAMVISSLIITIIIYPLPFYNIYLILKSHKLKRIHKHLIKEYFKFTLNTFLATLLKSGSGQLDTILLGYLLTPTSVGLFSLFKQFSAPLFHISTPWGNQVYPYFIEAKANKSLSLITESIRIGTQKILLLDILAIPFLTIAFFTYASIMNINLPFVDKVSFIIVLTATIFSQLAWWSRSFFLTFNPTLSLYIISASTIITVITYLTLGNYFLFTGICMASLITNIIIYTLNIYLKKQILK
ncbi:MAG: lipopolysaccharide biosynthesis protein [Desulfovibrio piger]|uniref:lipopolysaccharide biosynthesis protein n=1 Tax=Desulfovibrio piger TaxID=901 RepID=UPI00399B7494